MNGEVIRVRKRGVKGGKDDFHESSDEEIDPYGNRSAYSVRNEHVKKQRNNSHSEGNEDIDMFHVKSHPVINSDSRAAEANEEQKARFADHQKYLEALRISRLEALQTQEEADKGNIEDDLNEVQEQTEPKDDLITSEQFDLMQKTAQALHAAGNRSALEARIYANHGNDARFAFLRTTCDGDAKQMKRLHRTWQALKAGKNITLDAANSHSNKPLDTLVTYDSSEDEEEPNPGEHLSKTTSKDQDGTPIVEEDAETKRKRRLQLAHEWSKKKREERAKKSTMDNNTNTSQIPLS